MPPSSWPPRPHRHAASGQDRVCWKGRHYYIGPSGSAEARKRYAELLSLLAKEPDAEPARHRQPVTGLAVAELIERWDEYASERYRGGRELVQYRSALAPLLELYPLLPAAEFGAKHLDAVREEMIRLRWCRNVISRRIVRIRTVWRWAEQKGHVPEGRWAALRALAPLPATDARVRKTQPRQPTDWPTLARVCRMAPLATRAILLVCWYTGARPGELRQLRVGEIDRSADVWVARPGLHKNAWRDQMREIALGPKAQRVLARWLEGKAPDAYVFESEPGKCYHPDALSRAVYRAAGRAGVTFSSYQLRHSYKQRVTRALNLEAARSALGQKSVETTAKYASGADSDLAAKAARLLG